MAGSAEQKGSILDLRVLYVEDDKNIQAMMKRILERRFSEVICASDGEEALEFFAKGGVNLMIVDMSMPRLNGLDFCASVREIDEDIPIMVVTAFRQSEYLIEALQIGVDRFLFKPINVDMLDKHLRALIKRAFLLKQ